MFRIDAPLDGALSGDVDRELRALQEHFGTLPSDSKRLYYTEINIGVDHPDTTKLSQGITEIITDMREEARAKEAKTKIEAFKAAEANRKKEAKKRT